MRCVARGVRTIDVACPGFAVDCLETLEEMAMMLAERVSRARRHVARDPVPQRIGRTCRCAGRTGARANCR